MFNVKRQVAAQKATAIRIVNKKVARRANERLEERLINEVHLLRIQINSIVFEQAFEQIFEQISVQVSVSVVFRVFFDDRFRTLESSFVEIVSNSLIYRNFTDDRTMS